MTWLALAYFYACAALALVGALSVVISKNPIRGAMGLLLLIVATAALFLSLHAQFLAIIELIVYAGAIVVLFLFVIMLLGPSAETPRDRRGRYSRAFGAIVLSLFMLAALIPLRLSAHSHARGFATPDFGSIDSFGWSLFHESLVPFELSSALLMVAVLGAVAVARGRQGEAAHTLPSSQPGLNLYPSVTSTSGGSDPNPAYAAPHATTDARHGQGRA
jgi:NADH-quinone oxidoreductase subunit J